MRHDRIRELLEEFAAGRLEAESEALVRSHLDGCEECRNLLATYRLFADALGTGTQAAEKRHPASDTLARFAILPGELEDGERVFVSSHLEICSSCRQEAELVGEAVATASGKDGSRLRVLSIGSLRNLGPAARLAAAAVLATLVIGGSWALQRPWSRPPEMRTVAGRILDGEETFTGPDRLRAERMKLAAGADVTLRAGELVSLGEGFEVGPEASLVVEVEQVNPGSARGSHRRGRS